jgi:hypothetical protein
MQGAEMRASGTNHRAAILDALHIGFDEKRLAVELGQLPHLLLTLATVAPANDQACGATARQGVRYGGTQALGAASHDKKLASERG